MATLFENSGDSDQTPRSGASNLGLHCLPSTFFYGSPDYNGLTINAGWTLLPHSLGRSISNFEGGSDCFY